MGYADQPQATNKRMLPPVEAEVRSLHQLALTKEQGVGLEYTSEDQILHSLQSSVDHLNRQANQSGDPAAFLRHILENDKKLADSDHMLPELELVDGAAKLQLSKDVRERIHKVFQDQKK